MMKKGLMIVMCLFAALVSSAAEPLAAEWRAVDEALGKKHSRSAIGMLEKVESKALELKRWPDYTAARLRRLALDYDLADETAADLHAPKGVVAKFAGEIAAAPVVVRPMLRLALMHYYVELAAEERSTSCRRGGSSSKRPTACVNVVHSPRASLQYNACTHPSSAPTPPQPRSPSNEAV